MISPCKIFKINPKLKIQLKMNYAPEKKDVVIELKGLELPNINAEKAMNMARIAGLVMFILIIVLIINIIIMFKTKNLPLWLAFISLILVILAVIVPSPWFLLFAVFFTVIALVYSWDERYRKGSVEFYTKGYDF